MNIIGWIEVESIKKKRLVNMDAYADVIDENGHAVLIPRVRFKPPVILKMTYDEFVAFLHRHLT